jgi:hypothetical protein
VVVRADLADQVRRLGVQGLVGCAGRIALLDPLVRPGLAAVGAGRLRIVLALLGPADGKAGVEDAAGIERRLRLIEDGEGCDRGQTGRLILRGEELADASV